ncbi:MAG TPA: methionyl-tRNA formyltransferase [Steroidobacteraceae bacterium]|nr:methionyl-tRNA formyltransferase [Steroidobacteraceae bacterium]
MPRPTEYAVTAALDIIFAGTPEFSVPALEALVASGHRIVAVYTQPDRPAGRGQKITMSAVKACALKHGLRVEQPPTLRSPEHIDHLRSFNPDLMVVVAYGLILPQAVLDIPRLGCINIHASLLPRWRGAAPIHRAIEAGDEVTGVTIMRMAAGLDTGPMLLEVHEPIRSDDTTASLHDRLAQRGAEALITALPGIAEHSLAPRAQPSEGVTYAAKITKEEARIDWSRSAAEIDRQIRAFNPWPVAETKLNGAQLRVWSATALPESTTAVPGTIIDADSRGVRVATGNGVLALTRVQLAGRKSTSADEFIRGQAINGVVLGE